MASNRASQERIVARIPSRLTNPGKPLKNRKYYLKLPFVGTKGPSCDRKNMITSRE